MNFSGWTESEIARLAESQAGNAMFYRNWEKISRRSSLARQQWRNLATTAEKLARAARAAIAKAKGNL